MCLKRIIPDDYPNSVAESAEIDTKYKEIAEKMATGAVEEFVKHLTQIPRVSSHTEEIMQYLKDWAIEHNLDPKEDESGCIYWDVPAYKGYEHLPKVILQAHTDIVWATTDPNLKYDDPIDVVYEKDKGIIHSRDYKTTIGADDGQGIVTLLEFSKPYDLPHGPLRMLFTYDEETTMEGAIKLSPEVLDADYFINIDGRQIGIIRVGCSGVYQGDFVKDYEAGVASNNCQIDIYVDGLRGGHSANCIIFKPVSALDVLRCVMTKMKSQNIDFEIVSFCGGQNVNSIAQSGVLKICIDKQNVNKVKEITQNVLDDKMSQTKYDKDGFCKFEISNVSSNVFSKSDSLEILNIVNMIPFKLIEVHKNLEEVAKTSCNLGPFNIENGQFIAKFRYRYTDDWRVDEVSNLINSIKEKFGCKFENKVFFPAWPIDENPKFRDAYKESFAKACGIEAIISATHGCIECSYIKDKKPTINIISVGSDVETEHSTSETYLTKSLPTHFASFLHLLENIS